MLLFISKDLGGAFKNYFSDTAEQQKLAQIRGDCKISARIYYSLKVVVDQAPLHLLTGAIQESKFLTKYQRNEEFTMKVVGAKKGALPTTQFD